MTYADPLSEALQRPQTLTILSLAGWDRLVLRARQTRLLARIASMVDAQGGLDLVPDAPRAHLRSALVQAEAQHADLIRELDLTGRALAGANVLPILVGGSAYVATGSLAALGRNLTAIRLIVPTECLAQSEAALLAEGWTTVHHSPSLRQFHRRWMNGPAPLVHVQRRSVVLLRDRAVPGRAGRALTASALGASSRPLENDSRFATPGPVDQVLCAVAQLYCTSNPDTVWRDLSDLDLLIRHVGRGADFWSALPKRASELTLLRPLRHGLRWCVNLLSTPVPASAVTGARRGLYWPVGDAIWASALSPRSCADSLGGFRGLARHAFVYRALRLRVPLLPLLRHMSSRPPPLPSE
jgi:hypothetical protein